MFPVSGLFLFAVWGLGMCVQQLGAGFPRWLVITLAIVGGVGCVLILLGH